MSLQTPFEKPHFLPGLITWGCFVLILGIFWGYAFLLKDKGQTTQELLHSELRYLREENQHLREQNQQLEQVCGTAEKGSDNQQEENNLSKNTELEDASQRSFVYTVRKGDTIWDIAAMYSIDVNALLRWNNLTPQSRIFPGDQLTIILEE